MDRSADFLADSDDFLGAAGELLQHSRWSKACFCAQQAAELAVKAALNRLGMDRRGHDVVSLMVELQQQVAAVGVLLDKAKILDQYYIPTRYGDVFGGGSATSHYTQAQAEQAIAFARDIYEEMKGIVQAGPQEAE
ncbi:MAG: HEPN domain-containing protein [Deltaproteobacteria bacterium]|nr:HEPN domain-containing protein [Deltaproteobacteria bacterium]